MYKPLFFPFCLFSMTSVAVEADFPETQAKEQHVEVMVVTSSRQQQQLKLLAESYSNQGLMYYQLSN